MDLSAYLSDSNILWTAFKYENTTTIDVSTVWHNFKHPDHPPDFRHDNIVASECSAWLSGRQPPNQNAKDLLVTHVFWIRRDVKEQITYISEKVLESILSDLKLDHLLEACFTAYAGTQQVFAATNSSNNDNNQYCFRVHPKVLSIWSHDLGHNVVYGICFANEQQLSKLRQLVEVQWQQPTMMLPLACATMLSMEIDVTQGLVKDQIRRVETRTGYHNWKCRNETPAAGDLGFLSVEMSGAALKMAAVERKMKIVEQCLQLVSSCGDGSAESGMALPDNRDVKLLKHRTEMQDIDTRFIRQRIDTQLSALFNLITQNDAMASHAIAKQSKIVAIASQRDSTSMKTLAVVTIFYLPGQVIASILAMPLFNWTAGQSIQPASTIVNSRFSIYWAVTIPLTAATFLIAGLWLVFEQHRQRYRLEHVEQSSLLTYDNSEVGNLLKRRSTTITT